MGGVRRPDEPSAVEGEMHIETIRLAQNETVDASDGTECALLRPRNGMSRNRADVGRFYEAWTRAALGAHA